MDTTAIHFRSSICPSVQSALPGEGEDVHFNGASSAEERGIWVMGGAPQDGQPFNIRPRQCGTRAASLLLQ
jgi:hypothetical protein